MLFKSNKSKVAFFGLIIGLFSAIESFLLSLPVVYYVSPWGPVIGGTTVAVVMFLVSFVLVVRYYRSENQKTLVRLAMSLLASVATFVAAALLLANRSFGLLWAIGLSVVVLIGATTTVMIRHRPL